VFQVRVTLQLPAPEGIVQETGSEIIVPDIKVTETVQLPVIAPVVYVLPTSVPAGQVPPIEDMYLPASGVIVKDFVEP